MFGEKMGLCLNIDSEFRLFGLKADTGTERSLDTCLPWILRNRGVEFSGNMLVVWSGV